MARGLTAALKAEFLKNQLCPIALVEIGFASGTVRLWSGIGDLSWGGNTFNGAGTLGKISPISEAAEMQANGISLTLSGIPTNLLNYCLSEVRPSKKVRVWLGAMAPDNTVIVDPYLAFVGYTDVPTMEDNGESCSISISCEPRWIDRRSRVWRYTDQDQSILSPTDTGFRFTKDCSKPFYWGKATPGQGGGGGYAGGTGARDKYDADERRRSRYYE